MGASPLLLWLVAAFVCCLSAKLLLKWLLWLCMGCKKLQCIGQHVRTHILCKNSTIKLCNNSTIKLAAARRSHHTSWKQQLHRQRRLNERKLVCNSFVQICMNQVFSINSRAIWFSITNALWFMRQFSLSDIESNDNAVVFEAKQNIHKITLIFNCAFEPQSRIKCRRLSLRFRT